MPELKRTFIFADSDRNAGEIINFCKEKGFSPQSVTDRVSQKQMLQSENPYVFIINFDVIGVLQEFVEDIPRNRNRRHQLIVLCAKQDVNEVARMVVKGMINDYLIFRPIYDVNRLYVCIHQAFERIKMDSESLNSSERFNDAVELIAEALDKTKALQRFSAQSHSEMATSFSRVIDRVGHDLTTPLLAETAKVTDQESLKTYLGKLKTDEVERIARNAIKVLNESSRNIIEPIERKYNNRIRSDKKVTQQAEKKATSQKRTILVVDDNLFTLSSISAIMQAENFDIHCAANAKKAVIKAAKYLPDLILMDIVMPDIDGIELATRFKKHPELGGIPIVMISGYASESNIHKSLHAGASGFLRKPITREMLVGEIEKLGIQF